MPPRTNHLPKALLCPPKNPSNGKAREGLHSAIRRLCEHNQLTVNDVLAKLILPSMGEDRVRLTKMATPVNLINRGGDLSTRLILEIRELSAMEDLSSLTLREIVDIRGVGLLAVSRYRKWCPLCLTEDLNTEIGPYDRLLWSIDDVHACPTHLVKLQSRCQSCGATELPILSGRDVSGHCPKCLSWLGGDSISLDRGSDEYSRYLLWVAQSFGDLLDTPLPTSFDVGPGFRRVINALATKHFDDVYARLASSLERNRSVVGTWLTGRASPSWRALCEISFVFQLPLLELLQGQIDCVEFSKVQRLPLASLDRLTHPRKLPERRNVTQVCELLARVERGELPNILTFADIGARLGIHPRDLSRLAKDDVARLAPILAKRRATLTERKQLTRERAIREEVPKIVTRILEQGWRPTRRAVDKELGCAGLAVRRQEAAFVRELVQLAINETTVAAASGNN